MLEVIGSIPLLGGFLTTVLPFLVVIGIVVAVHEYGHYIVGRWCGIEAEVFSIGFGREVYGRVDKRGTRWRIGLLPLGGYVKFKGDADASSTLVSDEFDALDDESKRHTFPGAPLWARSATIAAGPIANFLLAILIYSVLISFQGIASDEPVIGELPEAVEDATGLMSGDRVLAINGVEIESYTTLLEETVGEGAAPPFAFWVERDGARQMVELDNIQTPLVVGVRPLSAASRAGIQVNDLIVSIDGTPTPDFRSLATIVQASEGQELAVVVRRGREELTLPMRPSLEDVQLPDGSFEQRVIIGVSMRTFLQPTTEQPGVFTAVSLGVQQTYGVIAGSLDGIAHIIAGDISPTNLQGPVGIAQVSGETASRSGLEFVMLIALISTAIGLMNLFPIPVLDGGHLLFNLYEAIFGQQPPGRAQEIAGALGLATVLSLMLFATYNDIARLLSSFV